MGRSKHMAPIHARMDKITAPITADVKYWFSLPSHFSLPRFVASYAKIRINRTNFDLQIKNHK